MCAAKGLEVEFGVSGVTFGPPTVKTEHGRLVLEGTIRLELPVPQQDKRLPHKIEEAIDDAGQRFKRWAFQQMMEKLDAELVLAERGGKDGRGIVSRGRRPMTFKTVFGTVRVSRHRILHKADASMEIPAVRAWGTPQQVTITQGLSDATCDAMLRESSRKSLQEVEQHAGEPGLLGRVTVLNLVHEEGRALRAAAKRRAHAVFVGDPESRRCLLPSVREPIRDEETAVAEVPAEDAEWEPLLGFPGASAADSVGEEEPRRVDADTVMVQSDEVVVNAQASTGCKKVKVYTAAVRTVQGAWYFCEDSAPAIIYLVGALLATLGVHQGKLRLLFVNDGARWIRDWFQGLKVSFKTMILCWYHLVKRCEQQLSLSCRGRAHRHEIRAEVLAHLWEGRVGEAIAVLISHRGEMKNVQALDGLIEYLRAREPYLPNYKARREAGLWIASNRVEKLNDWVVSQRCKGNGMDWTQEGVVALAVLEATRRNGELPVWRSKRLLPAWAIAPSEMQAA